jgi:hypothetical protein
LIALPSAKRQRVLQNLVSDLLDGAILTSAGVSNLNGQGGFGMSYTFVLPGYAQRAGGLVIFRPAALGSKSSGLLEGKPRKHPVVLGEAASESDVIDIALPAGYTVQELPAKSQYEETFGTYRSEVTIANGMLHYLRNYQVSDVLIGVERLENLKQFWRHIAEDERAYVILKAPAPESIGMTGSK